MRGKRWDIFCAVVDNFGDIGVSWRLARQLASEHGLSVRLWVDDLFSLHQLCPEIEASSAKQTTHGVLIRHWGIPFPDVAIADVVIEAFACELPEIYLDAMARNQVKPAWINLEYLSAEGWVNNYHRLASPHPRLPLTKYFFFPGFLETSGGLLREAGLLKERNAVQANPAAGWQDLDLPVPALGEISVSMFCYENRAFPALLDSWAAGNSPMRCLIPEGQALIQAGAGVGHSALKVGDRIRHGNLTLYALPFLCQEDYDRLLWLCDLNFVRGEDSFVRAQWAARPMVWQIYPQHDAAHMSKLAAFLALYSAGLPASVADAGRDFWTCWNLGDPAKLFASWRVVWQHEVVLKSHAVEWAKQLGEHTDLARQLVLFSENLL